MTNVKDIQGSQVIGENGVIIDIKRVLPVPEDSSAAVGRLGENTALANKKREQIENIMIWMTLHQKPNICTFHLYGSREFSQYT